MSRISNLRCDWCNSEETFRDEDIPVEEGWLEVAQFDMMREEIVHLDFCSSECLVSHFS